MGHFVSISTVSAAGGLDGGEPPQLADVRRYGRMLVNRWVSQARVAEQPTFRSLISEHLGLVPDDLTVSEESWAGYEHVNVQRAMDAWLDHPDRTHRLVGLIGYRHQGPFGLADLISGNAHHPFHGPRPGNLSRVTQASGPAGASQDCLRAALVLVTDGEHRHAALFRGPDDEGNRDKVVVEVVSTSESAAHQMTSALRELALTLNVYRGQVVTFGASIFGDRAAPLQFHERIEMPASDLVLPQATFDDVRRQVLGVARNRDRLRAAGQHLKRGLLLYGPPGTGKTHTVRYLVNELRDTTIVQLTGETLGLLRQACSIARALQPSMIIVEDVDLIAEQRDHYNGETPMLFTLLNEMDGLAEDADVVFLLTTNRADLLEPALAARPGRVDQAIEVNLPDAVGRRRLLELYQRGIDLDTARIDDVVERTDGVTASFLKELLRRAAVLAADRRPDQADRQLAVHADELDQALEDLLDTRNAMTRAALGTADR